MSDRNRAVEKMAVERLRSAAVMTDYQMERAARDAAAKGVSHHYLDGFPELREILPWVKSAA